MFKIVSDSPFISKRTPVNDGQTKCIVRATTAGKKQPVGHRKNKPAKKVRVRSEE